MQHGGRSQYSRSHKREVDGKITKIMQKANANARLKPTDGVAQRGNCTLVPSKIIFIIN
jgi:hypothetical protein